MKVFLAEVHLSITAFNLHCWCSFPIPTFLSLLPEQSPSKWYWKLVPVSELLFHQLSSTKSWLFKLPQSVCFHSNASQLLSEKPVRAFGSSGFVFMPCFLHTVQHTAYSLCSISKLLPHCRSEGGGVAIKKYLENNHLKWLHLLGLVISRNWWQHWGERKAGQLKWLPNLGIHS